MYCPITTWALGGFESWANDINDWGLVAGGSATGNLQTRPFIWYAGRMYDLGVLPGNMRCDAKGINNSGVVAGSCMNTAEAFRWQFGRVGLTKNKKWFCITRTS